MPYIGKPPGDKVAGLGEKDTFTGNGSTVAFDLTSIATSENDIAVFVDNVRQEPGSGKAFTLGNDGSGDKKRITFSAAPGNSAEIYVLNNLQTNLITSVSANGITATEIATNAVGASELANNAVDTAAIADDAVTSAKIADDAVAGMHIADDAVGADQLAANAVVNASIADDAVGADELAANAVVNASIASGAAIDATKIADGSVTSAEFQYINSLSSNAQTQITARLPLAGGTMSGETNFADQLATRPLIKDYAESYNASSGNGSTTLDLSTGNVFQHTASGGNVTFVFSNPPASGRAGSFTLKWIQDSSDRTITWPGSVDWAGGSAPDVTSGNAKVDIYTFFTVDGGTIWYGFQAGAEMG